MAERLSPGVFIEEAPPATNVISAVSTSTLGILGWTPKGPANTATFVSGFEEFTRLFGSFDLRSLTAYTLAAFFVNGGRRGYVVRVPPADAVKATAQIRSTTTDQQIENGSQGTALGGQTGAAASITTVTASIATITGLTGITAQSVGNYITISGAASSGNNGTFLIVSATPATSVTIYNPAGVASDANNGSITWTELGAPVLFSKTNLVSLLKDNMGASPIVGGTVSLRWRGNGTPVSAQTLRQRDGTTNLTGVTAQSNYEGRILAASLPAYDDRLYSVVPGATVRLGWTSTTPQFQDLTAPTSGNFVTTTTGASVTVRFDWKTGIISMKFTALPPDNATNITLSYVPAGTTQTLTLTPGTGDPPPSGQYNASNGAYQFTTTTPSHNLSPVLATYSIAAWSLTASSVGAWGNNVSVQLRGSADYYTASTGSYSRFNLLVSETDTTTNQEITRESYEDLVFSDPTSSFFAPDVVNEFSTYIQITDPGGNEAPLGLNSIARSRVIGGGNELTSSGALTYTATLSNTPIKTRTVSISYTSIAGDTKTIVDDGNGLLVGASGTAGTNAIDVGYTTGNTVNYTTGAVDFRVPVATGVQGGTLVTVTYATAPALATSTEELGDTTKGYTAGADGTFDSTNWGRTQFTAPGLAATNEGIYALNTVDDILTVVVPDFVGDTTVTGDMIDYAQTRVSSPAGGDRFLVFGTPRNMTAQQASDWFRFTLSRFSDNAALYWPWIKISDPLANNRTKLIPPVGHVAGIYARTDNVRNVGKSPGGTIDGQLSFLTGLERIPTQGDRDLVYPNKINPLISSPQTGNAVWGVRTISNQSQWRYINARRLFMFVMKSVYNATFWTVFENNGPGLWARIKSQLDGFLLGLFNGGYFAGDSPDQAFFVICDETINTPESIQQGLVFTQIGIAPNIPAEFVVYTFSQITSSAA